MKTFVTPKYTFNPGTIGSGYIDLNDIYNFNIKRLVAIINQTSGKVIYSTASESFKYLSYGSGRLFFGIDTSSQNATDDIQIIYDEESNTIDMTVMLNNLISIIANPGIRDKTLNADRIAVVNTVPVTISSGTVTNLSTLSGYQSQIPVQNNNIAAWYLSCRSKIT
jgi:hypothetical protein